MSSAQYRSQIARLMDQRVSAEKRLAELRKKESEKRVAASKARASAATASSGSTMRSRLREAERFENDANAAGKDAASQQTRIAGYLKDESRALEHLHREEASEARAAQQKQRREVDRAAADLRRASDCTASENRRFRTDVEYRLSESERAISVLRDPKREKLRVLVLTASGKGDLRIGREVKRIQDAVRAANHRDLVEIDVRPAATPADLLSGLTESRPHVVHFSGHSNEQLIVFEEDSDAANNGVVVTAEMLEEALRSVDDPPLLVVLNSCASAPQAERLTRSAVKFSIGMSESIEDADAINFAARFYAAIADGQSIGSATRMARTELMFMGAPGADLPTLAKADGADEFTTVLVLPPDSAVTPTS